MINNKNIHFFIRDYKLNNHKNIKNISLKIEGYDWISIDIGEFNTIIKSMIPIQEFVKDFENFYIHSIYNPKNNTQQKKIKKNLIRKIIPYFLLEKYIQL